jgi:hypothetical protein
VILLAGLILGAFLAIGAALALSLRTPRAPSNLKPAAV